MNFSLSFLSVIYDLLHYPHNLQVINFLTPISLKDKQHNIMSNLTDQEVVRRENLQKIEDLGFNPFPAEKVEVNFKTTDYTTPAYQDLVAKKLEELNGVGAVGAAKLRDALFANKFRTSEIMKDEALVKEFKLSENASFDATVKRKKYAGS